MTTAECLASVERERGKVSPPSAPDGKSDATAESPFSLAGRRVVVTGACSSLGRAVAQSLSRRGAEVALSGRHTGRLEATLDGESGAELDLREFEGLEGWLLELARSGPLDGLVHCACVRMSASLKAISLAAYEELMRVYLGSALALAQALRRPSAHSPDAAIVFLSTVSPVVGHPGAFSASPNKAALGELTRALAQELVHEKIRVNCVSPGHVGLAMSDRLGRRIAPEELAAVERACPMGLGTPEDVTNAVAFLVASSGRFVTGATLLVDGGYR